MMLIYLILLEYATLVASPYVFADFPFRTDYYKSLSDPQICMEVSHFYPTAPLNLYGLFEYRRHSILPNNEIKRIYINYAFNRIDRPCETSIIFSTFGDDFRRIDIRMELSLAKGSDSFSSFEYKFYNGFKIGTYTFTDIDNKFGMRIRVINGTENHIELSVKNERMYEIYEKSKKTRNNALCIITENNLAVVLKTNSEFTDSSYFITGLEAEIYLNGKNLGFRTYHTYSCNKEETYPDVPIIFIIDEEKVKIKFKIHYRKHFEDAMTYINDFEISNPIYDYVHNLKNVSVEFTKVFLINSNYDYKSCKDGSQVYIYLSEDQTIYFTYAKKGIEMFPFVEGITRIHRFSKDPCAELKK